MFFKFMVQFICDILHNSKNRKKNENYYSQFSDFM